MSDRFAAEIIIGGDADEQTLTGLIQAADMDHAREECGEGIADEAYFRRAVAVGAPVKLQDNEACAGTFENLERFCQVHRLAFRRHSTAWYSYEAKWVYWRPGMVEPASAFADQSGDHVLVPLAELQDALEGRRMLEDILEDYRPAAAPIPPLRVLVSATR